jgi:hypothetical protein
MSISAYRATLNDIDGCCLALPRLREAVRLFGAIAREDRVCDRNAIARARIERGSGFGKW